MQLRITLQTTNLLLVQMTNYFPTTYFGAVALVENANWKGPLYVIIFAVISFVFFVLFYYIAERTYLKGVIGLSTSTAKRSHFSRRLTEIYGTKFTFESICEKRI